MGRSNAAPYKELVGGAFVFEEIYAPEAGGGREKLHTNALAAVVGIALEHDAALLIFLGLRMRENQQLSIINFIL